MVALPHTLIFAGFHFCLGRRESPFFRLVIRRANLNVTSLHQFIPRDTQRKIDSRRRYGTHSEQNVTQRNNG